MQLFSWVKICVSVCATRLCKISTYLNEHTVWRRVDAQALEQTRSIQAQIGQNAAATPIMQSTRFQLCTATSNSRGCPALGPGRVVTVAAGPAAAKNAPRVLARATPVDSNTRPVPASPELQISQAVTAVESAWQAGVRRQRLELLLPLIGATDLDDWPGGVRQQFKAAAPLVEGVRATPSCAVCCASW